MLKGAQNLFSNPTIAEDRMVIKSVTKFEIDHISQSHNNLLSTAFSRPSPSNYPVMSILGEASVNRCQAFIPPPRSSKVIWIY